MSEQNLSPENNSAATTPSSARRYGMMLGAVLLGLLAGYFFFSDKGAAKSEATTSTADSMKPEDVIHDQVITTDVKTKVVELYNRGYKPREIAKETGLAYREVRRILKEETKLTVKDDE